MESIRIRRIVRRWRQRRTQLARRLIRDASDPLSLDTALFVSNYRVTKERFVSLCGVLGDKLDAPQRCTSIPTQLKILTTLSFLASGSYQKPVAQDMPISQAAVSRSIDEVIEALNNVMALYIKFPSTQEERNEIKQGFYEKFNMPGVIGCIDGTLIAIVRPRNRHSEAAFLSQRGYYAINTSIICDSNLKIIGVNSKFGGAAHDSYVWRLWDINSYLEQIYQNGEVGWLLGDLEYPQQPWLMTPVQHAAEGTPEALYTGMHVRAHVCVERCIALLKNRWECLLPHRVLHYGPTKSAKIINACAVLHNLCHNDGLQIEPHNDNVRSLNDTTDRQQLVNVVWQNRTQ